MKHSTCPGSISLAFKLLVPLPFLALILTSLPSLGQDTVPRSLELFRDTSFSEGFGASWSYGSKFTLSSGRKEGGVTAYREIWPWQVHLIPEGSVTKVGIK